LAYRLYEAAATIRNETEMRQHNGATSSGMYSRWRKSFREFDLVVKLEVNINSLSETDNNLIVNTVQWESYFVFSVMNRITGYRTFLASNDL